MARKTPVRFSQLATRLRYERRRANEPIEITNTQLYERAKELGVADRVDELNWIAGFYRIDPTLPWTAQNMAFDEKRMKIRKPRSVSQEKLMLRTLRAQTKPGIEIITVEQWVRELSATE